MNLNFEPFQIGEKVTPWDTWAENMPAALRMRRGRLYCVEEVIDTAHGPQASFVGVHPDRLCKGFDCFWPTPAFRSVHRAGDRAKQKKGLLEEAHTRRGPASQEAPAAERLLRPRVALTRVRGVGATFVGGTEGNCSLCPHTWSLNHPERTSLRIVSPDPNAAERIFR